MTVRAALRLVIGLALALFLAASWSTPSEAHGGHREPAAATQPAEDAAASDTGAAAPEPVVQSESGDCAGHVAQPGSGPSSCCGAACHAVISADLASLQTVTVAVAVLPGRPAPPPLAGPTTHIKRPPRPSAALVG
jgi:hypothetical protein